MLVVLSPHLDDVVLSAYLTLARVAEAVVVNVFDGVPADGLLSMWDKVCGATSSREVALERRVEDDAVLSALGVGHRYLGLLQGSYRDGEALDGRELDAEIDRRLEAVLAGVDRPELLAPIAGGPKPHPDHRIVREAARRARTVGLVDRLDFYADFPYCAKAGSWPAVWGGTADVRWAGRLLRELDLGAWVDWRRYELDAGERAAKLDAMRGYRTQFGPLDRKLRTKGLVSNPELYGVEVIVPAPRPTLSR